MGQAKQRGNFEVRKAESLYKEQLKREEKEKEKLKKLEEEQEKFNALSDEDKEAFLKEERIRKEKSIRLNQLLVSALAMGHPNERLR